MSMTSILRPVVMPPELIGQAAPCDLFNASGVLMLRAGARIGHGRQDPSEPLRFHCPASFAARICHVNPARELSRIALALGDMAERVASGGNVSASELRRLADDLLEVWRLDADACLGAVRLSRFARAGVRHAILVALLALETGAAGGVPIRSLPTLAGAGLSMNLTKLALHDEMFERSAAPDAAQRREIVSHPAEGARLLRRIGQGCEEWIPAVAGHHENIDGSGYPAGLKGASITVTARILRVADTLAARLTGRRARSPVYWNLSRSGDSSLLTRHVFGPDLALLDKSLAGQLMRSLGPFPPGSLVRLSNRELAVVTRRTLGAAAQPRQVFAITDTDGRPLETPTFRRTGLGWLAIRAYAQDEASRHQSHGWSSAWGYDV
ncbi:HD domain-containing phosphohydrolase [Accumulibacter sp.]|uniref:HD-GYP domain-containing protein n=1 Tax=Accumulibacter sp. TaxID=2053492 RepID=UPI00260EA0C6|nr:HD domain-containing phosphohydrolase [Accumulibacter sp.]